MSQPQAEPLKQPDNNEFLAVFLKSMPRYTPLAVGRDIRQLGYREPPAVVRRDVNRVFRKVDGSYR